MANLILDTPIPAPDAQTSGVSFKDRYIQYLQRFRPDADAERYWLWRESVLQNAHGSCSLCGRTFRPSQKHYHDPMHLDAHHIKSWRAFPDLRYETTNGRAVCRTCHNILHERDRRRWAVHRSRTDATRTNR